jgi:dTDP-4-amino-4,6-dideoxygalactose transaminase
MTMPSPKPVPFHHSLLGTPEINAARAALESGDIAGNGPVCRQAEALLRKKLRSPSVFLVPSGTAALELSLMALRLGPGDEVILPSFNFVSAANAVVRCRALPVFADVSPLTLNLDPADVEKRLTPRTRAVMLVHYGGFACDMDRFLSLSRGRGFKLIEDAALGLGASWKNRPLGGLGDLGCFSFHATKHFTCGEGGALACRDKKLARKIEIMRENGTDRAAFLRGDVDKYTWRELGSSFVLSDLQAAVLRAQLGRWPCILKSLKHAWNTYARLLQPLEDQGRIRLPHPLPRAQGNGNLFWFILDGPWRGRRAEFLARLRKKGVPAVFHYVPLHDSPYGKSIIPAQRQEPLAVTEWAGENNLRLPLFPGITGEQCQRVAEITAELLTK